MFKYIRKIAYENNDNRTVQQKIDELRKIGINVSVRREDEKYKEGYVLGR